MSDTTHATQHSRGGCVGCRVHTGQANSQVTAFPGQGTGLDLIMLRGPCESRVIIARVPAIRQASTGTFLQQAGIAHGYAEVGG